MKSVWKYLKEYKAQAICSPLFKLLEVVFELIVPLVVAAIIDKGVNNGDTAFIIKMGSILVLLGMLGLVSALFAQYFAAKAAVGTVSKLRLELFKKIQSLSVLQSGKIGSSTLINRLLNDSQQIQTGLNLMLRLILRSPFVVFGSMIMAFTVDVRSALVFVGVILVLTVVIFAVMLGNIKLHKAVQAKLDKTTSVLRQTLTGVRVIRAFCKENHETEEFVKGNADLALGQKKNGRIAALLNPMTFVIINIGIIYLLKIGAVRVDSGALSQGSVVALYNYMTRILIELVKLASLIIGMARMAACAKRVEDVLNIPCDMQNSATEEFTDTNTAVRFENVSFRYSGGAKYALKDVTFSASCGETIGVIGGTGSGKSTLASLIARFYDPTEGEVYVNGANVRNCDITKLRKKIGFVLQTASLFRGTVRDNMKVGRENATDDEIISALKTAQAYDFVSKLGGVLDFVIAQRGANLSGGQKQRLCIARALVRNPEILILDDSSSALDFATDARLRSALKGLPQNITTFVISQRTSALKDADRIIVLDGGDVVGTGRHDELIKSCEVYKEIHLSQTKEGGAHNEKA